MPKHDVDRQPIGVAVELSDADAGRALVSAMRHGDTLDRDRLVDVIAAGARRWRTEPFWRAEASARLAAWDGDMEMSDELPELDALLDPALWAEKLRAEWPAESPAGSCRIAARPLGLVAHVCPGNGIATPVWSALHGALAGNWNLVKLSRRAPLVAPLVFDLLVACGLPAHQIRSVVWERDDDQIRRAVLDHVDGLAVWGDESTMAAFRRDMPAGVRWIEHGPRLSVSVITRRRRGRAACDAVAVDVCRHEQRTCASTQCLLVEVGDDEAVDDVRRSLLGDLSTAFAAYAAARPPLRKSNDAQMEMLKQLELAKLDRVREQGDFVSGYPDWLIIWQHDGPIRPSCLFRTLHVRPYRNAEDLAAVLSPCRRYLQTAAVSCGEIERDAMVDLLWRCGVTRVITSGTAPAAGATPQDGRYLLPDFLRMTTDQR